MKAVDTSVFVATKDTRVKPENIDLGELPPIEKAHKPMEEALRSHAVTPAGSHAVMPARRQAVTPAGSHAVTQSRSHDGTAPETSNDGITSVLQALQEVGTEKGTVRLTKQEKATLARVVYNFRQSGLAVSENEIMRIALNYLLEEDEGIRPDTVLAQILSSLKK